MTTSSLNVFLTHAEYAALPQFAVVLTEKVGLPVWQWLLPEGLYAPLESAVNIALKVAPFAGFIPLAAMKLSNQFTSLDTAAGLGLVGAIASQVTDSAVPVAISIVAAGALGVYAHTQTVQRQHAE